ncbi:glyoxalase/bleomycin resistance protein/dioxygenase superfamily protein [Nocardia nova SH22a]|uniref:Glyoxalase/bleomycin resistance protein/dioxygenase superfamily protein n=1 Tax=Nocardia nova SH22a TaxID=1415166 RepID=W5TIW8_9NOCA|nr:VOC family protein [Nocardia nova]AHH19187.1 glyoxalase/bleomycin resistance protein/dioxygenase superfamily protein [Nocardia nova SH22a]
MLAPSQFRQIAWVVDDLDAAVRHWRETTGIGPFFVGAHIGAMITDTTFRGRPVEIDISAAIAYAGSVQIELIQQHDDAPSPYRDVYAVGEGGIHHMQAFVDDVDAQCRVYEKHGFEVVMTGAVGGLTPVAYVDTRPMIGCMTELMSREGPAVHMFDALVAVTGGWDGADPVRDMAALMS